MHRVEELMRDCRLLFGRDAAINRQFLESLQLTALKTAFRRRALCTHPDLFSDQERLIQQHHAELFMGASEAYRRLSQYVILRGVRPDSPAPRQAWPPRRPTAPTRSSAPPRPSGFDFGAGRQPFSRPAAAQAGSGASRIYAPHCAPGWTLRTGEFLYYAKVIPWKQLISAIIWQRQQRERIGEIAQRWGWLSEMEIREAACGKYLGEKLGEALLRYRWITSFQLSTLLWQQRKSQQPIGRFFVEGGVISEASLNRFLADLQAHNRKCRSR